MQKEKRENIKVKRKMQTHEKKENMNVKKKNEKIQKRDKEK